jgi:hypothetical protein
MHSMTVDMPTACAPNVAKQADLGRGLVVGPGEADVDALGELDALGVPAACSVRAGAGSRRR